MTRPLHIDWSAIVVRRRRGDDRGLIFVYTVLFLVAMMAFAGLAIDVSWLYDRRERAQTAADTAALAGDWALAHGQSDSQAVALATQIAASYGYDPAKIVVTPHSNSVNNNLKVHVTRDETMFFGYLLRYYKQAVTASATAWFPSYNPTTYNPQFYGNALGNPFCLCAYGPDQGATRGDAIDTRWNDLVGDFTKGVNPLNLPTSSTNPPTTWVDHGADYWITPAANYSSKNPYSNGKIMVQIYDPQTYINPGDPQPFDQYVNANGSGSSSPVSPSEKWRYTIYRVNNNVQTQVATVVYGEGDTNLASQWVTPPGFVFDTTGDTAGTQYILNVRTDDGNGYPGTGYDKNGYQLRAGPDYSSDPKYSSAFSKDAKGNLLTSPSNAVMPDASWNAKYSNVSGGPYVTMGAVSNLSITAHNSGTGDIYFGYAGPNPNTSQPTIVTFSGFDEDTGASGINYTCDAYPGVTFVGTLPIQSKNNNGNGIWSAAGSQNRGVTNASTPSNTVYFGPGTYTGGNWTAHYTTGSQDVSTWNWTVNYKTTSGYPIPRLIYTDPSSIY